MIISVVSADFFRFIVLAQIAVVIVLYVVAAWRTIGFVRPDNDGHSPEWRRTVRILNMGRLARIGGIIALLIASSFGVFDRLGHPILNPVTPFVQIGTIALVFAWVSLDRIDFKDHRDAIDGIIEAVQSNDD
jgi:hypothetical protein